MKGLNFLVEKPVAEILPNRMDVACFVGLVGCRAEEAILDDEPVIKSWLERRGYFRYKQGQKGEKEEYQFPGVEDLHDVPVPIEDWQTFDRLFAWDQRPIEDSQEKCATYLGVAVKSFFEQGGRRCYVVRVDKPAALGSSREQRDSRLDKLLVREKTPGRQLAGDREQWSSFLHLFGLEEVNFLCLPDLPDLCQSYFVDPPANPARVKMPPEEFVECSQSFDAEPSSPSLDNIRPPFVDGPGLKQWGLKLQRVAAFLALLRREVQLVASIPLLHPSLTETASLVELMHEQSLLVGELDPLRSGNDQYATVASAFVQLCYPWIQSDNAWRLPQQLECPEGVLTGMLARNALTRGTFRSAAAIEPANIIDVYPALGHHEIYSRPFDSDKQTNLAPLVDRVSLFSPTVDGVRLLSDVTTSNNIAFNQASVGRLTTLILRISRTLGEEYVFETNGENLWARIRQHLSEMLGLLFRLGAFRGASANEAFHVRCDRSTMTQNDLDSGRVVAVVQFQPTVSIETIDVVLLLVKTQGPQNASLGIQVA